MLKLLSRPRRRAAVRPPRFTRLEVEYLEHRASPTTLDVISLVAPPPPDATTSAPALADGSSDPTAAPAPAPVATAPAPGSTSTAGDSAGSPTTTSPGGGSAAPAAPATAPGGGGSVAPAAAPANSGGATPQQAPPPVITDFGATPTECCQYTLEGTVSDPGNNVGGLTVTIQGDTTVNGQVTSVTQTVSVTPANGSTSDGTFQLTIELQQNTTAYPVTHVYSAVASDGAGHTSEQVTTEIVQQPQQPSP